MITLRPLPDRMPEPEPGTSAIGPDARSVVIRSGRAGHPTAVAMVGQSRRSARVQPAQPSPPPFTADDYAVRMERVVADAVEAGLDGGILVTPAGPGVAHWIPAHGHHRAPHRASPPARPRADPAGPRLERPDAEAAAGRRRPPIRDWADGSDPYAVAGELLTRGGSYAVSDSAWSMHLLGLQQVLPATRYQAMTQCLPMLRAVKDDNELARLAAAGAAADATFLEVVGLRFAGRRESEVAADLAGLLREFGHEQVDFTVVGSGPNGANPTTRPASGSSRWATPWSWTSADCTHGYGSDTTRTVCVGEPRPGSSGARIVREAQQAAFEAVRPGVPCREIDRVARAVITQAGYGEQFIHRTGHGIGSPPTSRRTWWRARLRPLRPGMCFSIEPGIYLSGRFGVRIEDIVTVTADGGRRLNTTDHGARRGVAELAHPGRVICRLIAGPTFQVHPLAVTGVDRDDQRPLPGARGPSPSRDPPPPTRTGRRCRDEHR